MKKTFPIDLPQCLDRIRQFERETDTTDTRCVCLWNINSYLTAYMTSSDCGEPWVIRPPLPRHTALLGKNTATLSRAARWAINKSLLRQAAGAPGIGTLTAEQISTGPGVMDLSGEMFSPQHPLLDDERKRASFKPAADHATPSMTQFRL